VSGSSNDPVLDDPVVARVRTMLAEHDPDVLAAVDDVDRTLITSTLRLDPLERVRSSVETALFLERWSRCSRSPSKR
jgi:hypothetical protein